MKFLAKSLCALLILAAPAVSRAGEIIEIDPDMAITYGTGLVKLYTDSVTMPQVKLECDLDNCVGLHNEENIEEGMILVPAVLGDNPEELQEVTSENGAG